MSAVLSKTTTLAALPPEWPADSLPDIRTKISGRRSKLVVLDDDPTGTQTVHDIAVVTDWSVETLANELAGDAAGFYILTNSRSLAKAATVALHRELAANLQLASSRTGVGFSLVSRSDSTLRGHFPLETDTLAAALPPVAAIILIPYFEAGGRLTLQGVHYVAEGDHLVPAAETPFARDATFGYQNSDLRKWVEEKTGGRITAAQVSLISLDTIRQSGPAAVSAALQALPAGSVCVIDAVSPRDIATVALGTVLAENDGRRFLYRTGASFVAARLGLIPRPLLDKGDFTPTPRSSGGLVVVGSYVPKTTAQLRYLRAQHTHHLVELSVPDILNHLRRKTAIAEAARLVSKHLEHEHLTILATSRDLVSGNSPEESLAIVNQVSAALVETIRAVVVRPRFFISKGGITSSDIATAGLGVRRALVRGQILPGVPVWRLGAETRFPGLDYIVFPGNVGSESALSDAICKLEPSLVSS